MILSPVNGVELVEFPDPLVLQTEHQLGRRLCVFNYQMKPKPLGRRGAEDEEPASPPSYCSVPAVALGPRVARHFS